MNKWTKWRALLSKLKNNKLWKIFKKLKRKILIELINKKHQNAVRQLSKPKFPSVTRPFSKKKWKKFKSKKVWKKCIKVWKRVPQLLLVVATKLLLMSRKRNRNKIRWPRSLKMLFWIKLMKKKLREKGMKLKYHYLNNRKWALRLSKIKKKRKKKTVKEAKIAKCIINNSNWWFLKYNMNNKIH